MTTFYLMRHGEPDWALKDARGLTGPIRDYVPLTADGIAQAERAAEDPRLKRCELILSSPYTRALQTAAVVNRTLGLPLIVEFDLHEWTPDSYKAESYEEIKRLNDDYHKHGGVHPPGESRLWETKASVLGRVMNVLRRYSDRSHVLVVCHGMIIAPLQEYGPGQVPLCSVHEFVV
ncbi:histidine phosphatase family protein [Paenibacillus chartarius]|uniref:Histidine phosphatase family protein n=1 Tax=Paenibacillus chartarius TaxID=747481 RepID=A0ABV6DSN5_9BACL